jgi:hypothetical protein
MSGESTLSRVFEKRERRDQGRPSFTAYALPFRRGQKNNAGDNETPCQIKSKKKEGGFE